MNVAPDSIYRHSGTLGSSMILVPVLALIAAVILSTVYAYISVYSPIAGYISLLFVLGFGFGLAWSIGLVSYLTKCRNTTFLRGVGFFVGLFALYTSWVLFEYALLNRFMEGIEISPVEMFFDPAGVWGVAANINEEGWYSISGATPAGVVLWIFWGIEAVLIVGMATVLAPSRIAKEVFCEHCENWCPSAPQPIRLALPVEETSLAAIVAGHVEALEALEPATASTNPHLEIDVKRCPRCERTAGYQVQILAMESDNKGDMKEKRTELTEFVLLTPTSLNRIEALRDRPPVGQDGHESREGSEEGQA